MDVTRFQELLFLAYCSQPNSPRCPLTLPTKLARSHSCFSSTRGGKWDSKRQHSILRLKYKVARVVVVLKGFIFLYLWNLDTKAPHKILPCKSLPFVAAQSTHSNDIPRAIMFGFALADCASNTLVIFRRIKSHQ